MKLILRYMRKYIPITILSACFMIAEVLVDLIQPQMMETIVDDGILGLENGGVSDIDLIVRVGIRMVLLVVVGGACGFFSGLFISIAAQNSGNNLRKDCFARIMHLSAEQTDRFTTGSLITRITNDVTQVQNMLTEVVRGLVRCGMFFAGGTFALVSLDLSFAVILAIAIPLLIVLVIILLLKTSPLFSVLQKNLDSLNNVMRENVSGFRVVKAFTQEKREEERFRGTNRALLRTQLRVQVWMSLMRPVMNIVLNLAVVAIIWIGGIEVQAGALEPGSVMAAITYISQILNGVMMLAMVFQVIPRGMVSSGRLREILDTEDTLPDGEVSGRAQAGGGSVVFEHVCFAYPGSGEEILHDINLQIRPGEMIGIMGATGCGKSSLVHLIPRFYDVTAGSVKVDGIDVREYQKDALRQKITICLQKSELFSTTIEDNIAIGDRDAAPDAVRQAAAAAQADPFIRRQRKGYLTRVTQAGMSLSGGQRQRVAISRALLRNSPVLILDDSTSALDLKTEAELYRALRGTYADCTKIIIAQRIASVRSADRIVVLDKGTVESVGTHEELLESSPVYQEIYRSQLRS